MKKIFIFLLLLTLALAHENPKKILIQIDLIFIHPGIG